MVGQSSLVTGMSSPDLCELSQTSEQLRQMTTKGDGSTEMDDSENPNSSKLVVPREQGTNVSIPIARRTQSM